MIPDWIHKVVMFFAYPATMGVVLAAVALLFMRWKRLRLGRFLMAIAFVWLWLWSTPLTTWFVGLPLERNFPPARAEAMPCADAICILGGGMGVNTNNEYYANMQASADRVWHGARLFNAKKAPVVTLTGPFVRQSTVPFLSDLGVPEQALRLFEDGKNTEDEARMISTWLKNSKSTQAPSKILLVTSACHMRRAKWLFEKAGLDVTPAACDYCAYGYLAPLDSPFYCLLLPSAESLALNSALFKEHFAYWCYRMLDWLRGGRRYFTSSGIRSTTSRPVRGLA